MGVSANGGLSRSGGQKFVHLADASNLVTRGVDGEDKDKDDREEHGSVGAVVQRKVRVLRPSHWKSGGLTSHRGG